MNHVREFRKNMGLSQLELAKSIGVSRQTINMIENNKYNPTLELCLNLAKALDTDLNSLFWDGNCEQKYKIERGKSSQECEKAIETYKDKVTILKMPKKGGIGLNESLSAMCEYAKMLVDKKDTAEFLEKHAY